MMLRFITYNSPISPIIIFGKGCTERIYHFLYLKIKYCPHCARDRSGNPGKGRGIVRETGVVAESPPGRPNI